MLLGDSHEVLGFLRGWPGDCWKDIKGRNDGACYKQYTEVYCVSIRFSLRIISPQLWLLRGWQIRIRPMLLKSNSYVMGCSGFYDFIVPVYDLICHGNKMLGLLQDKFYGIQVKEITCLRFK